MAATGISVAAPASAGCEPRPFVTYCDKPIRPDGSWRRCFYNDGGGANCYDVAGFGLDPYPWAPPEHID
jgi:hypothetical protein